MFENPAFTHNTESCYFFMEDRASLAFPLMELWHYANEEQTGWHQGWHHLLAKQQLRGSIGSMPYKSVIRNSGGLPLEC